MKSRKFLILLVLASLVLGSGCSKKFNDYAQNSNQPLPCKVPAGIILKTILNNLVVYPAGDADKQCQFYLSNYTYYGLNTYWSGSAALDYGNLNNVLAMESEAKRAAGSDNNP